MERCRTCVQQQWIGSSKSHRSIKQSFFRRDSTGNSKFNSIGLTEFIKKQLDRENSFKYWKANITLTFFICHEITCLVQFLSVSLT